MGTWYCTPFASAVIVAMAFGAISTWTPTATNGIWIGCPRILGVVCSVGFKVPIIAGQNNPHHGEVTIFNALLVFAQNRGGANFLPLEQVILSTVKHNFSRASASWLDR